MEDFYVGQHVVCIDDDFNPWVHKLYEQLPEYGKGYTVRAVRIGVALDEKTSQRTGAISLLIVGLINPFADKSNPNSQLAERGFDSRRFRPLDELKTETRERKEQQDLKPIEVESPKEKELVEV